MDPLTHRDRAVLRHTLGLNYTPRHNRNHFCADPDGEDYRTCKTLTERGLMSQGYTNDTGSVYFHATLGGMTAMGIS